MCCDLLGGGEKERETEGVGPVALLNNECIAHTDTLQLQIGFSASDARAFLHDRQVRGTRGPAIHIPSCSDRTSAHTHAYDGGGGGFGFPVGLGLSSVCSRRRQSHLTPSSPSKLATQDESQQKTRASRSAAFGSSQAIGPSVWRLEGIASSESMRVSCPVLSCSSSSSTSTTASSSMLNHHPRSVWQMTDSVAGHAGHCGQHKKRLAF